MEDKRTQFIKDLIAKNWTSVKAFAESINMPYTTLQSMLQRGIGNASVNNVFKVCKGLGISTKELENISEDDNIETIAAHHDGEEWTEEELEEIERFKEFVKSKRKQQE